MIYYLSLFVFSSILYIYLNRKTRISLKFLYIDNIIVWGLSCLSYYFVASNYNFVIGYILALIAIPLWTFVLTMMRFFRTPKRKSNFSEESISSPADGNIIYIRTLEVGNIPFVIKGKSIDALEELIKTDLIKLPCKIIGINLTPFDVHKNSSPISGNIILQKHTKGHFYSLKLKESVTQNERNTFVIANDKVTVCVVQIASKIVRRIVSYKQQGELVKRGDWLGMITFGSQVDLIIPLNYNLLINVGDQVYASETLIAEPQ